jgi:site-specific DNA-methyltransferase (adenine-specific)
MIDKIHLADAYEFIKQLPDNSVDLIHTDPPYQIDNTKAGGKSQLAKSIQGMNDELKSNELVESIDTEILYDFIRVMKKPNIYIWCNHKQIPLYLDFFVKQNKCSFDIIVWKKTNAMPLYNNKYLTDKEYCLYFRKGGYCSPKNYEKATTVYFQPINLTDKTLYKHCTIKPLNIVKTLIENSTKPKDTVLDCFVGSGTTAVACKELDRQFICCENNPKWHKVACDRLNKVDAHGQQSFILR